ncbi:MAG: c-type cytochrome [Leadbetterella sp.]|nr:c-type cytochrome [Leadbetterella sp.]
MELLFARTGQPDPALKARFIKACNPYFPGKNETVNRQLAKLLVYLEAPGIARKLVSLLETSENSGETAGGETATSSEDLILRNPAYGMDIARMLEKLPPARQTYYAVLLSPLKTGWTPELQEKYLRWYQKAFSFRGGLSYVGFLDRARETALSHVPRQRYAYFDKISGGDLLAENGNALTDVTFPKGPGRSWKTDEAAALFEEPLTGRNFEQGRNMYLATLCNRCHTLQGEGANVGPDLTRLGTRFTPRDILEAIIEPNKAVSDQYAATQLQLRNGDTRVGKVVAEDEQSVTLSQNPFTPDITMKIAKKEIVSRHYSSVSMMLPGLVNSLNEEELKDLMAYLVAGGDKEHIVFKQ